MARTRVAPPPNIPRIGEVPTGARDSMTGNTGWGAAGLGGEPGRGVETGRSVDTGRGGGGASTGGIANPASTDRGAGTGGDEAIGGCCCIAGCCGAFCARERLMLRRMLEITPMRTIASQMMAPRSCIDYRGGCGGCVTSGGPPPSTLLPIESRMPVSACRFLSL
jgi:hypothetical protein